MSPMGFKTRSANNMLDQLMQWQLHQSSPFFWKSQRGARIHDDNSARKTPTWISLCSYVRTQEEAWCTHEWCNQELTHLESVVGRILFGQAHRRTHSTTLETLRLELRHPGYWLHYIVTLLCTNWNVHHSELDNNAFAIYAINQYAIKIIANWTVPI